MSAGGPVLVIDDDESIREFVAVFLTDEGYEVLCAAHGEAGLALARQSQPGVILLDIRMPVMDGRQFAEAYRSLPGPRAPVVVLTAALDAEDESGQIAADDYLAKPFDLDVLLAVVRRHAGGPARP